MSGLLKKISTTPIAKLMATFFIKHQELLHIVNLSASLVVIFSVFILEYGFGFLPCIMCIYQRIPYVMILWSGVFLVIKRYLSSFVAAILAFLLPIPILLFVGLPLQFLFFILLAVTFLLSIFYLLRFSHAFFYALLWSFGIGLSFYHFLIEKGFADGPSNCGVFVPFYVQDWVAYMAQRPYVSCKYASFSFIFSLATWNIIFSLGMLLFCLAFWWLPKDAKSR